MMVFATCYLQRLLREVFGPAHEPLPQSRHAREEALPDVGRGLGDDFYAAPRGCGGAWIAENRT